MHVGAAHKNNNTADVNFMFTVAMVFVGVV